MIRPINLCNRYTIYSCVQSCTNCKFEFKLKLKLITMIQTEDSNNIYRYLDEFNGRLDSLEQRISNIESRFNPVVEDKMALFLTVPDTIRKSLFAISHLERGTADEVSAFTGRHRSIENKYLNELVRSGWLGRDRVGKKVYYYLKKAVDSPKSEYHSAVDELEDKLESLLG